MTLGLVGILVSITFLIVLAYRGVSVLVAAPVAAMIAVICSGAPVLASYTQVFMPAVGGFIINFFPLFLTGAIFGTLMSQSGSATQLAHWISGLLGPGRAIMVVVLATAMLNYGGVNAWVVVFTAFPIATALFREADIPRRLMPPAICLGVFSFASVCLPGSPQIHNAIPTRYFGTNTFAAPFLGLVGAAIMFGAGMAYLNWRRNRLRELGEHFSDPTLKELREIRGADSMVSDKPRTASLGENPHSPQHATELDERVIQSPKGTTGTQLADQPHPAQDLTALEKSLALLPILMVAGTNAVMTYVVLPSLETGYLASERFGESSIERVAGVWSVLVAMIVGILTIFVMKPGIFHELFDRISEGAKDAVLPVVTTATEVGYGAVITSLAAFVVLRDGLFGLSDNALITSIASTFGTSAVTGSSSGGLTISLESFGEQLAADANAQGISMEVMHRLTTMSSAGFDSLPHNGAIITVLLVCGLTHRESYKDIGVVTVIIPVLAVAVCAVLGLTFGTF